MIEIRSDPIPGLDAQLDDLIYAYNSRTTGVADGTWLGAGVRDDAGELVAAVNGHTWGRCCEILHLWVRESHRRQGLGTALMDAAETEARRRGCGQVLLSTHSFQAPLFYERRGYRRVGAVADYPPGHAKLFYVKALQAAAGASGPAA
jgi:GNAT superfamily N-acetyltransferase